MLEQLGWTPPTSDMMRHDRPVDAKRRIGPLRPTQNARVAEADGARRPERFGGARVGGGSTATPTAALEALEHLRTE